MPIFNLNHLPSNTKINLYTEPDCYGASAIIANKLKIPFRPRSFAYWSHGWKHLPIKYVDQFGVPTNSIYLVATENDEAFLNQNGKNAKAVGLPFVYADEFDDFEVNRFNNTLLVMPPHGMSYTTKKWAETEYLDAIRDIINDFETTVACIHPADIANGNWIDSFKKMNIKCIEGARMDDANALLRMRRLFRSFEFVTTNSIGSHVAYAAYCGCKTSIYGPYDYHDEKSLREDELYKSRPDLLKFVVDGSSKSAIYTLFPDLFVEKPQHAIVLTSEAQKWLGKENMVDCFTLSKYLGWHPKDQIKHWSAKAIKKMKKEIGKFAA